MGYPAMAIAACFGGPMLNILLGVGLSGTYMNLFDPSHRGQQLYIEMNTTLLVSGVGLFAILVGTLIVVPLNSYRMSKRVGATLILAYLVRLALSLCPPSPFSCIMKSCKLTARLPRALAGRAHDERLRGDLFVASFVFLYCAVPLAMYHALASYSLKCVEGEIWGKCPLRRRVRAVNA